MTAKAQMEVIDTEITIVLLPIKALWWKMDADVTVDAYRGRGED
jgi:hypothetical protein